MGKTSKFFYPTDRSFHQTKTKQNKMLILADITNPMNITDIYQIFHSNTIKEKYTFISTPHVTFYWINHIIGHKASVTRKYQYDPASFLITMN